MANRTVKDAKNIHGTNPQYLIEKIIRSRIYDSKFWKEQCFALTAELLVDKGEYTPACFVCQDPVGPATIANIYDVPFTFYSDGNSVYGRRIWRQYSTDSVPLSNPQDATNPAGKGHCRRVHQE